MSCAQGTILRSIKWLGFIVGMPKQSLSWQALSACSQGEKQMHHLNIRYFSAWWVTPESLLSQGPLNLPPTQEDQELQMVLESQLQRQPMNSATGILPIVTGAVFRVKGLTPEMSTDSLWPALQLGYWLRRAQKKGNWLFMRLFGFTRWLADGLMPLKSCNSLKKIIFHKTNKSSTKCNVFGAHSTVKWSSLKD